MSCAGTFPPQIYLREARKRAGCSTLESAAVRVPWSPQAIQRHECGKVRITPLDAVTYADCYQAPDILPCYCEGCPVGQRTGAAYMNQMRSAIFGLVSGGQMESRRQ